MLSGFLKGDARRLLCARAAGRMPRRHDSRSPALCRQLYVVHTNHRQEPSMIPTATDRLHALLDRIAEAARRSGRPAEGISLVAVTKTVPFERVRPYLAAGVKQIGENRVQEAVEQYKAENGKQIERP